jgi:hypothetical protein
MTRELLFKSKTHTLELITFDCRIGYSAIYREIIKQKGQLIVKEHKDIPLWYIREMKLKELGL